MALWVLWWSATCVISTVAGVVFAARSPKSPPSILLSQHACLSESVTAFGQDGLAYTKAQRAFFFSLHRHRI